MKKVALLILLLHGIICSFAQESYLRHYSTNEGLPSSETYWVMQDRSGYIWIASDMGVSRFDGYRFRVFTTADGLTDNTIFRFHEDPKGRIWFYTFSGKLCYYFHDTIYGKNFPINEKIRDFLGSDLLTGINVDGHDTILMSTSRGLIKIMPRYENGTVLWDQLMLVSDRKSFLSNTGYTTVEPLARDSLVLTRYDHDKAPISDHLPMGFRDFLEPASYSKGSILLFHESGTILLDSMRRATFFDSLKPVISYFRENDSSIWIGEKRGGAHLFTRNMLSQPQRSFLHSFSVTCVFKDREGGYWFTTLEDGLFYLPSIKFTYFEKTVDPRSLSFSSFSENLLYPMGGGKILGLTSKQLYGINNNEAGRAILMPSGYFPGFISKTFWNLYEHSNGEIWASASSEILVFDHHGERLLATIRIPPECKENDSRQILEDSQHEIWSLNKSSLIRIDHLTKKVIKVVLIPSRAQTFCEDMDGTILIGTVNGMYRLSGDSLHFLGDGQALFKSRFVDIKRNKNTMICATRGAGILILDGDSIYQVSLANGLLSNMCRSIYVDSSNTIWAATNNGLNAVRVSLHPFRAKVRSFSTSDGLLSNDNDQVLKDKNTVWLLSKKGVTAFDPDIAVSNDIAPPVYITRVRVNNKSYLPEAVNILDYATNFIEIDYVGLTYRNAGKQLYKYKLEGYDTTVKYTQTTSVQFTKLPPGDYRFLVCCVNSSGVESISAASFSFKISAPFYQKWWFSFLVFLIVTGLIIFSSLFYIRRIRKREVVKTEINRKIAGLQLQALRSQMNPHFIFNCLNAIQDFILKNDAASAKYYLSMFSKLIRITLNGSRKTNVSLIDEIAFLELYLNLEKMRFSDKFIYRIDKIGIDDPNIEIPSMILQPFIENSIRHGRIGNLQILGELILTFSMKENMLTCRIEDNGIGVDRSQQEKDRDFSFDQPHALGLINDRIRTINELNQSNIYYTIIDKSSLGQGQQGTEVNVYIPVK